MTISGGGLSRVFQVDNGASASITGLTISGGSAGYGGGPYNLGTTTLTDCTITGNTATDSGGGIQNQSTSATLTLIDCTISGNSANYGGGLGNDGTATLTDSTIAANSATVGGGLYINSGTAMLTDTIVGGNTAGTDGDIGTNGTAGSVTGTYNLIGSGGSGGIANGSQDNIVLTSQDIVDLGSLQNNGGPTATMALLPGSLAIGAGTASTGVTTDQRGFARPSGNGYDIGAFEDQLSVSGEATGINVPAIIPFSLSSYLGTFSDPLVSNPGQYTSYTVTINWGDGSPTENSTVGYQYAKPGTYTIFVTVQDQYGDQVGFPITATVLPAPTTTTLSSANPVFGQTVLLTATVTGPSGSAPTGSVEFFDGNNTLETDAPSSTVKLIPVLDASGNPTDEATATISYFFSDLNTYSITATYQPDVSSPGLASSTSSAVPITAVEATSTTTLSVLPGSVLYGDPVILTASVSTEETNVPVNNGTVTFYNGTTFLGSVDEVTISSGQGQAQLTLMTLPAGMDPITATYTPPNGSSTDIAGSTSPSTTVTVNPAPLTVTASNQTTNYDDSLPAFSGTITGLVNGDTITATYGVSGLSATPMEGTYTIVPTLNDPHDELGNYQVATVDGTLTIDAAPTQTMLLSNNPTSTPYGESLTLVATVSDTDPTAMGATPVGTVTFSATPQGGSTAIPLGSVSVESSGQVHALAHRGPGGEAPDGGIVYHHRRLQRYETTHNFIASDSTSATMTVNTARRRSRRTSRPTITSARRTSRTSRPMRPSRPARPIGRTNAPGEPRGRRTDIYVLQRDNSGNLELRGE